MMGAVNAAARAGGARTVGVIPRALVAREIADEGVDELLVTDTMRERKALMEAHADAFLTLPGGIGTCEEFFEVWTAGSLGMHAKPVVLLDPDGHYDGLLRWLHGLGEGGFLHDGALARVVVVHDVEAALDACAPASTVALTPTAPHAGFTQSAPRMAESGTRPAVMSGARVAIGADPRSFSRPRRAHAPRHGEVVRRPHLPGACLDRRRPRRREGRATGVRRPARAERGGDRRRHRRRDRPADARRRSARRRARRRRLGVHGSDHRRGHRGGRPGGAAHRRRAAPAAAAGQGRGAVALARRDLRRRDRVPRLGPRRLRPRVRPLAARPDPHAARCRPRQGFLPAAAAAGDDRGGVAGARRRARHRAARPPTARGVPPRAGRGGAAAGRGVRGDARAAGVGAVRVRVRRGDRLAARHPRPARARRAGAGQPGGAQAPQPQPAAAGCDVPADPRRRAAPLRFGRLGRPADPVPAGRRGVAADVDRGGRDGAPADASCSLLGDPLH